MKRYSLRFATTLVASACLASGAWAVTVDGVQALGQDTVEMSIQLLDKWQGRINSGQVVVDQPQSWAKRNAGNVAKLNSEHLKMALAADTLAEVELFWQKSPIPAGTSLALIRNSNTFKGDVSFEFSKVKALDSQKALGNDARDLVFTPVTPCRMLDTRFSNWPSDTSSAYNAGGNSPAIAGGRALLIQGASTTNYQFQGGFNGNCMPTAASPKAYLISLNALNPSADGYFTAYSDANANPYPASVSTFYRAGVVNTAFVIMNSDSVANTFSRVFTTASTHITLDVQGYFEEPQATALDCTTVLVTGSTTSMTGLRTASATCATGYAVTGGSCDTSNSAAGPITGSYLTGNGWTCESNNYPGNTTTYSLSGGARCCRTPGRL